MLGNTRLHHIGELAEIEQDESEEKSVTEGEEDRLKKCLGSENDIADLQDFTKPPVMVGGDVVGLYPNMDIISTAELSSRVVQETDITFSGVNYKMLAIYLFLVLGPLTMINLGLGGCVPRRLSKTQATSLASRENRKLHNWDFDDSVLTEKIKRLMLGEMLKIGNLVTMN